jgi:hypothetical protein
MEPAVGAWCVGSSVCFRLPDQHRQLESVRLACPVLPAAPDFSYDPGTRTWELCLPRPAVQRIEYRLELSHPGGGRESVADPHNPRRAGDSSVLWFPG